MTDPQLATTFEWGRMYARTRGGTPEVPSITTVLGMMAQDLEWWEALCAVQECITHAERLVRVKNLPPGPPAWAEMRQAKDWLMAAAERDRDAASSRGDIVHNYAEAYAEHILGRATQADVDAHWALAEQAGVVPYLESFHAFWETYKPRPVQAEATVWSSKDRFAGTTDLICDIDTGGATYSTVLDYKTRRGLYKRNGEEKSHDLHDYTGMQLAAAALAEEVWQPGATPADDTWVPNPFRPQVALAVALAPDGYAVRQYDIYHPLVWSTFTALRAVWDYKREGAMTMSPKLTGPESIRPLTPHPTAAPVEALAPTW